MSFMYSIQYLREFTESVFQKIGLSEQEASQASEILLKAELRNISTHGLVRLPEYVKLWKDKRITVSPNYKIVRETPSTALVDGGKGLGLVTAPKAMNLAIEKAGNAGTGWVAVRNSYHFGIAGYYAMKALEEDMIGIAMTNANPLVAPTFGKNGMLGTNPIAFAVPAGEEPPFVADFATAPISRGKVDEYNSKGLMLPENLLQESTGNPTIKPSALQQGGAIKTLGGDLDTGGHKGFCLTSIVDILSAVLPGANFGPFVVPTLGYAKGNTNGEDKGIGHFFGAMRIDAFQSKQEFKSDMDKWIRAFRQAPYIEGSKGIVIPGDPEREAEKENLKKGINLNQTTKQKLKQIAKEMGLNFRD